MHERIAGDGYA